MVELKKRIGRSVFVVEDDLELSTVIDRILISIDPTLHLEWATTAEEAIATLVKRSKEKNNNPYDLMICDIFLEGARNGLDLWKFCHTHYPSMKVVVISGIDLEKLTELLDSHEEVPLFLSKPFSVSDCSNLLESLLVVP
ncbi:MAG: response regulator [Bacteriovorax sp.]|nr:response regulator [Bacteriovorax sp.]